ncbi:MAG: peptidoglycan D,D-transpeptidase FtsI family protein [Opitutaceae bacterium]
MSKGFASSYRIVLLATGLLACFGGLGVRLVWLHVIDRDSLLRTITKVRHQVIPEFARRGDILDARGGLLATSRSRRVLGVDPMSLRPQDEKLWPRLAAMIGMPDAQLRRIFLTKYREPAPSAPASAAPVTAKAAGLVFNFDPPGGPVSPVPDSDETAEDDTDVDATPDEKGRRAIRWVKLRDDVPEKLYEDIMKLGIKGVYGDLGFRRAYPNKELAAHVIGFVNRQQEAVAGIEAYADFYLRGQNGWRVGERDGRNRELPQFLARRIPPSDGYSVMLSIDTIVQDIVEQELTYLATTFEPLKASIVVSDPRNGFILAMANYPTFDPNEYNKVPKEEQVRMKNVAVADIYDPGSVFKIVPAAAALEERLVAPQTVFDCSIEKVVHRGRVLTLPGEDHRMGEMSVSEIISRSSNRGAAQLGLLLGEARLYRYARAFGFGAKLGFPVGGEVSGILNPYKEWYPIDVTRIPMGHSVSSTVLQMHQAMSVIAAGGVLLRPQVITQIRDASNEVVYRFDRVELGRAISARTAAQVATMLMAVVKQGGTAVEAAIEGYDVAGKTGTSQKFINGEWSKKHHVASFVGFFPAGNPQIAISVIVDDGDDRAPGGVAYGRTVAAPSFKRIGERLIPIRNIQSYTQPAHPSLIAGNQGGRR